MTTKEPDIETAARQLADALDQGQYLVGVNLDNPGEPLRAYNAFVRRFLTDVARAAYREGAKAMQLEATRVCYDGAFTELGHHILALPLPDMPE